MASWPKTQPEFGFVTRTKVPSPVRRRKRAPERDPSKGGHRGPDDVSKNRSRARNRLRTKIERESRRLNFQS